MRRRLMLAAPIILVAGGALLWVSARPKLSQEQQIAQVILQVKQAVEAKRAGALLRHLSKDYDDGVHSRREITQLVIQGFRSPDAFRVHVEPPKVDVQGDRATARVRAEFWAGPPDDTAGHVRLDVNMTFARSGRRWKILGARGWEPAMSAVD